MGGTHVASHDLGAAGVPLAVDVTDRWARQVGQVDIARANGAAMAAANPLIAGIYDIAGNRMPSMDVVARAGFMDPIDRWARQLGLVDLSRVLGAALTAANPVISGIYDVAGNRMPSGDVDARAVHTLEATLTAIVEGQVTMTGAAQQFPADPCKSITIENPITNALVSIGHDNAVTLLNGYRLQPGATVSIDIDNANRVWCIGTAPQIISYLGVV